MDAALTRLEEQPADLCSVSVERCGHLSDRRLEALLFLRKARVGERPDGGRAKCSELCFRQLELERPTERVELRIEALGPVRLVQYRARTHK